VGAIVYDAAAGILTRGAHNTGMLSYRAGWGFAVVCLFATAMGCGIADRFTGEKEARQIRAVGVPADATVVQIWDTGVTVNNDPVVGFLLEVKPENQATFQAKTKALVSRLAVPRVQPGARLRVFYDPKDTSRVAVDRIQ
jgi:hypothetical protein